MLRAISIASENTDNKTSRLLIQISEDLRHGLGLTEAMGRQKLVFGRFDLAVVSAGEQTGRLDESFKMLADWYHRLNALTRKAISALVYPAFVLHVAALVFYLPGLVLGQMKLLGYIANVGLFLGRFYLIGLLIFIVSRFVRRSILFADTLGRMLIYIPIVGSIFLNLAIHRFAMSFAMMYRAGLPIDHALDEVARLAGSPIRPAIKAALAAVASGQPAYVGLKGGLPTEYVELWQVGEDSGQLDKAAEKIGQLAGERAQYGLEQMAVWLPRLIYVAVMVMVIMIIMRLAGQVGTVYWLPME